MTTSAVKNNNILPPGLVSNLQDVLRARKGTSENDEENSQRKSELSSSSSSSAEPNNRHNESAEAQQPSSSTSISDAVSDDTSSRPLLLVTSSDGIESPGLTYLVQALVRQGRYSVHVCAPQLDQSVSGHSITLRETIAVTSAEIDGATAYEVSGTPADCVSLALSGALFSWSKPLLVISGINRGSSCAHHMFCSGVIAGAREALISGVPSISISLNWRKDESQDIDFKDAATVCLPLLDAAIRDIENGVFPTNCSLSIEVPTSPLTNKGFKLTKQSLRKSTLNWQAVSSNRHPSSGRFMSNQQILGMQLAQLSRDASAAGAARRLGTQKKNIEVIESVGASGKSDPNRRVKYFRLELLDKDQGEEDEELDSRALENGFIAITPISVSMDVETETRLAASEWISTIKVEQ